MNVSDDDDAPVIRDRAALLRYRIACCRDYLRNGVPVAMAIWYLAELHQAEAELRIITEKAAAEGSEDEGGKE